MPLTPQAARYEQQFQEMQKLKNKGMKWLGQSPTLPTAAPAPRLGVSIPDATSAAQPGGEMGPKSKIRALYDNPDEIRRLQDMNKPKPAPVAPPGPASFVAQAAGASAMGATPAMADVGPKPVTDPNAIRRQNMARSLEMYENSKRIVDARRAGTLDEGVRQQLVDRNSALRGENRLAEGALAPAPTVKTPQQNADWLRNSDYFLGEQAGQKLRTMAPDDPMRAGYQAASDHFRSKYFGTTPNQVAQSLATGGIAGPAMAFAEGAPRADAAYAQAGEAATGRQTARVDNAEQRRLAFEKEYFDRYGTRTAADSEQKRQQQNEVQQRIARDEQMLAERDAMTKRAQAEAATAGQMADPAYAAREQQLRMAQFDAELAKARGAAAVAGSTSRAEAAATQREAAKMESGFDESSVLSAATDLSRNLRDRVREGGRLSYDNNITPNEVLNYRTAVLDPLVQFASLSPREAAPMAARLLSALPNPSKSGTYEPDLSFVGDNRPLIEYAQSLNDIYDTLRRLASGAGSGQSNGG